jgi:DNA segregation ATPase FtsK/SpoIIIE-like protein
MDQLEVKGIVGPIDGSKPRKIYAQKDEQDSESLVEEFEDHL